MSLDRLRANPNKCLFSDDLTEVARLMLCLAQHIQQLPSDLRYIHMSLPAPLDILQE